MLRIEDEKLDSSGCAVNSHYEPSSCFQQKFVVWALAAYRGHFPFPTLAYLQCTSFSFCLSIAIGQCSSEGGQRATLSSPWGGVSRELFVDDELWLLWPGDIQYCGLTTLMRKESKICKWYKSPNKAKHWNSPSTAEVREVSSRILQAPPWHASTLLKCPWARCGIVTSSRSAALTDPELWPPCGEGQ